MRQRAPDSGHNGFWTQGKNYQVSGSLTLEEKLAHIQAMKAKTQCCKCVDSMATGEEASAGLTSRHGEGGLRTVEHPQL